MPHPVRWVDPERSLTVQRVQRPSRPLGRTPNRPHIWQLNSVAQYAGRLPTEGRLAPAPARVELPCARLADAAGGLRVPVPPRHDRVRAARRRPP
eukprot:scaffold82594_cov48-Phaeocystis_antarctica.AAC.2